MDRSKIVAVITGIISIVLAIAYLLIVQIIDFRGEMLPAPTVDTIFWTSLQAGLPPQPPL
jgi:hypothetical protein